MSAARKLTDAIKEDHQEMYEYHERFNKAKGDVDAQTRWARQLTWEIARHAVGEEIVVYPLMEKHLGQHGLDLANQDRKDHLTVKTLLSKLESLQPGTAPYDETVSEIMKHLHEHNDREETNDLPILEAKIGAEGSEDAAASFARTKQFAPTRAHPSAPDRPPYETLSAFIATPIDKLKDMFAKFPTEEMKQAVK
ncbi:hypothetical protein BDN71DRAFT_1451918 [Pleurotus eryngii]|uniref:Hemerythrin-like domain-containing protein n=1 Tax=Pleurotus eryngii TaxID=5323 RepID=A0A9P5ZUQ3_PLEER|nr:hypothetical protein BDN71DRAFT_1451918 [Pleurotus eryngii]